MHTYIVRDCRARPEDIESASGIIEDVESGKKTSFHTLAELQAMIGSSIMQGQMSLPIPATQVLDEYKDVAVIR